MKFNFGVVEMFYCNSKVIAQLILCCFLLHSVPITCTIVIITITYYYYPRPAFTRLETQAFETYHTKT